MHIPTHQCCIATQGPLKETTGDFWQMIYEYKVQVIVMLCNLTEKGEIKCYEYWGQNVNKLMNNNYTLTFDPKEETNPAHNVFKRKFELNNTREGKSITVYQLHFTGWPDHGIPSDIFKSFNYIMDEINNLKGNSPYVCHCSAGIGRTGTFLAIFNLINEIKDQINKAEIKFSIMGMVRKLKELRYRSVDNKSQYFFIYDFVKKYLAEFYK